MITGKNVVLRLVEEKDLDAIVALSNDANEIGEFWSMRMMSTVDIRKKYAEGWFLNETQGSFLVTDRKDGRLLGMLVYFKGSHYGDGYEIGGRIFRRADRGGGSMTEAVRIFCAYLFEKENIQRLQATAAVDNTASRRTLEKAGFQHEGVLRRYYFVRGRYHDLDIFSMLREEAPDLTKLLCPVSIDAPASSVEAATKAKTRPGTKRKPKTTRRA